MHNVNGANSQNSKPKIYNKCVTSDGTVTFNNVVLHPFYDQKTSEKVKFMYSGELRGRRGTVNCYAVGNNKK